MFRRAPASSAGGAGFMGPEGKEPGLLGRLPINPQLNVQKKVGKKKKRPEKQDGNVSWVKGTCLMTSV